MWSLIYPSPWGDENWGLETRSPDPKAVQLRASRNDWIQLESADSLELEAGSHCSSKEQRSSHRHCPSSEQAVTAGGQSPTGASRDQQPPPAPGREQLPWTQ